MKKVMSSTRREMAVAVRRKLDADSRLVWSLMSDTNRWNRFIGMNPTTYRYRDVTIDGETKRMRVGGSTFFGLPMRWVELGGWVEGHSLRAERRLLKGAIRAAGLELELEPDGASTILHSRAFVAPRWRVVGGLISLYLLLVFWWRLRRYTSAVAEVLARSVDDEDGAPLPDRVRAYVAAGPPERALSAPGGEVDLRQLDVVAHRLRESKANAEAASRLIDLVRSRPEDELAQFRPFELADAWGLPRRDVLAACLYACRAGLLDLSWRLNCPTCRVAAGFADELGDLSSEVHCADCDIGFDLHFGDNVEAVCSPNQRVRDVPQELHCGASAWFRPHVFALVEVPAGGVEECAVPLPEGALLVRVLGQRWQRELEPTSGLDLVVTNDGIEASPREEPGYSVRNESGRRVTMQLERAGWSGAIVRGSLLLTMPEFLDLFATAAPATGRAISVGRITVLFVDIVGSTQLYASQGDARAFALVSEQLDRIDACVRASGGAVVKTIGDAVMASFPAPRNALEAAIQTLRANREATRERGGREVALRFGIHDGPCLMVRSDDRIDFFGGTVNLAARVQGRAAPGQVVVVEALLRDAGVMDLLASHLAAVDLYETRLKGLEGDYALAALALGDGHRSVPPGEEAASSPQGQGSIS